MRRAACATFLALLALDATGAWGQTAGAPGTALPGPLPDWATRWSPLRSVADIARELPSGPSLPDLLAFPAPRVGLLWTAGNPAALAAELEDARVEFRFGLLGSSGTYARPLDPGGVSHGDLSTLGWRRLGERGAVIGGATFERTSFRDSLFADVLAPYRSNPFIVIDTIGDPVRRTGTRVEGATGWRFGRIGLGVALGWEGLRSRTIASPVPRLVRTASPGAVAGATLEVGRGVRLGAHGSWRQAADFTQVRTVGQASRLFQLEGYEEPTPLDLERDLYQRRFERTERAVGAGLAFQALGATWALLGQREEAREDQFTRVRENDPPKDRWQADGWTFGGAAQWSLDEAGRALTVEARYTTVGGEAERADIEAVVFTTDEKRFDASADLRWRLGSAWRLGGRAEVRRDVHERRDLLAPAASEVRSWHTGGAVEVARALGPRLAVSAGGRLGIYGPSGSLPDPDSRGPVYVRYIAPELALALTEAVTGAGALTLRWQAGETSAFWVQGELGTLDPREASLPMLPDGTRRGWRLLVGAVLDEAWP